MLQRKYQGREQSRSRDEAIYTETWYGTETEVDEYISTLSIGTYVQDKGYLHQWEKKQDNPVVWQVEVTYRVTFSTYDDVNEEYDDPESTTPSPKTYTLSVRNIQKPLELHPNYRACWNHYLIGLGDVPLPAWYSTATNTMLDINARKIYMWVSSISEIPLDPDVTNKYWKIVGYRLKPAEVYDEACFVVTEKSKHKTSAQAGQAISHNINQIGDPPHKFGITGGEWKLDEGSVEHDGKRWIATRSWTRAEVWDADLYGSN
jgi:hypothetical protein